MCLCEKSKSGNDILPLKMAEEHLRRENKANREESKAILASLQNAHQIIAKNIDVFRKSMKQGA